MSEKLELSTSSYSGNDIEKDAERAYDNLSMETRVVNTLVNGVDDEEFEQVWEEKVVHTMSNTTLKTKESSSRNESSSSFDTQRFSTVNETQSPANSSTGFQTVSLTALPGSRLQITRGSSITSSENSNSSSEGYLGDSISAQQDSTILAAIHMKPRGLASSNKPPLPNLGVNAHEQAQAEWQLVENIQKGDGETVLRSPEVKFPEVLQYFQQSNSLEQYMSHIKPVVRYKGCAALSYSLFGPPAMKKHLHAERNLIFALALCMFDNEDVMHNNVLQTIYKKLAGTKLDCPRFGNHWELVGFQGMDPSTDLRGCGFLGLLNILYIVTDTNVHSLATNIFKLSQHETQNFPFSVMSINITRIALQTLREGKLNRECNRRGNVFDVFNQFFIGIFHRVYTIWKCQRKTISDSGFVLREVEKYCKSHTSEILQELSRAILDKKVAMFNEEDTASTNQTSQKLENFSGVCDIQENEEEEVHLV